MEDGSSAKGESTSPLLVHDDRLGNEGLIPQFFPSVPALNEAATYISQTTSYLGRCFSNFVEEAEDDSMNAQELVALSPRQTKGLPSNNHQSTSGSFFTPLEPPAATCIAPPMHDRGAKSSTGDSSQKEAEDHNMNAQELVALSPRQTKGSPSNNHQSTSGSFFTSLEPPAATCIAPPMHDRGAKSSTGDSSQSTNEQAESTRNVQNGSSIFQSLISRARKTVLGSARDIGWLQGASAPVEDGTQRFTELLDSVRNGEHKLPNSMVYLLVPGLFSNHGPLYFVSTKTFFSKMGLACHIAKIHSEASVEKNARELKEYIEEVYWGSRKRIMVLGHSKGGVDAAAALSMYWSDLKDKVAGLALLQSPYGGSPIASDILREGQLGDYVQLRKLMEILICKVIKGDMQALEDLTYERRKEFLSKHQIPKELPVVSFHTEASIAPAVLATLSHVAHAELPLVSPLTAGQPTKVPVVMPLAAAMAACAQLLQIRYGEKSDGLVTRRDAEVPGSVVVRPERKLDHAWMVYSSLNDDPGEADASQVCEALLTLLVEVGQKRRHEIAMKDE